MDDYHLLAFFFESSQLRGEHGVILSIMCNTLTYHSGRKYIRLKSMHDAEIIEEYSKQYIYLAGIKFINSVRLYKFDSPSAKVLYR